MVFQNILYAFWFSFGAYLFAFECMEIKYIHMIHMVKNMTNGEF